MSFSSRGGTFSKRFQYVCGGSRYVGLWMSGRAYLCMLDCLYSEPRSCCETCGNHNQVLFAYCFSIYQQLYDETVRMRGANAGLVPRQGFERCSGRTWQEQPGPWWWDGRWQARCFRNQALVMGVRWERAAPWDRRCLTSVWAVRWKGDARPPDSLDMMVQPCRRSYE